MDTSEKKIKLLKKRLTSKEIEKHEESLKQIRDAEALFFENPVAHQTFLDGVHSAREFGIAVASGDENPEEVFGLTDEGTTSVEEIRAALRTLVQEKAITPEQAKMLTWQDVQKLAKASGLSLSELSEEAQASDVYVAEPPSIAPLTELDLIMDVELRRAAADRKKEGVQEGSWATLSAHLEKICQQVINDAETLHQGGPLPKSPDEFHQIAMLLSRMPKRFRRQAFCQCICGVKMFQRMPIIVTGIPVGAFSAEPLGIRIPMHVPAASPAGCPTVLTWSSCGSEEWKFLLPSSAGEIESPKTVLDLDLEALMGKANSGDPDAANLLSLVERNDPLHVVAAWQAFKPTRDALLANYELPQNDNKDPWYDVIRNAREIFWRDTPPNSLLEAMGLSVSPKTNDLKCEWNYAPRPIPNEARFKDIYKELKRQRSKPRDVAPADPSSREKFMRLIRDFNEGR